MEQRIIIVNELIVTIANCGRNFFKNTFGDDEISYFFLKNKKLFMLNEYTKKTINLSNKQNGIHKNFTHGSTLWGLTIELSKFIKNGTKLSKFSTLYSPYWGYLESDMENIQNKAKELGIL